MRTLMMPQLESPIVTAISEWHRGEFLVSTDQARSLWVSSMNF